MSYLKHRAVNFTKGELDYKTDNHDEGTSEEDAKKYRAGRKLLLHFAGELSKHIRGITFAFKDSNSLFVFMEGEYMCMGWIGHGDFLKYATPENYSYVVYSRHISNKKYDYSKSEQHYMSQSVNMNTAIKNCKKYLRNYNTVELADIDLKNVKRSATQKVRDIDEQARNLLSMAFDFRQHRPDESALFKAMRHVLRSNFELPDNTYKKELVKAYDKYDEYLRNKEMPVNMLYVKVYERLGTRTFDVIDLGKVATGKDEDASLHYHTLKNKNVMKYDDDTIPEYIVGKISVLSMLDIETYVDDVGYRASVQNTFYVVRDDK